MLKGHLDMIVLAALVGGPAHGYGVIQEIEMRPVGRGDRFVPEADKWSSIMGLRIRADQARCRPGSGWSLSGGSSSRWRQSETLQPNRLRNQREKALSPENPSISATT